MQNKAFSMEDLFAFLNAGVSAFHSTAAAAAILEAEGYRNCPESAAWHPQRLGHSGLADAQRPAHRLARRSQPQ